MSLVWSQNPKTVLLMTWLICSLQGIKDYAEQQRRLQQDIKTYLERNRDLAHKQLREHENVTKVVNRASHQAHEDRAKVKTEENLLVNFELSENNGKSEIANEESELMSAENSYIPSEDKISRPKLLFLEERSPERDLESPACVSENFGLLHTLEHPEMLTLTLPSASGQNLLSPQYCPKMTAKKLFSVTRVTSPTLAPPKNPLLDTKKQSLPVPHICTPLSSVPVSNPLVSSLTIETLNLDTSSQVEVDSCLIQQKLECETLETYLQELVNADEGSSEIGARRDETDKGLLEVVEKQAETVSADNNCSELDANAVKTDQDLVDFVQSDADTESSEMGAKRVETDSNRVEKDLVEFLQDGGLVENDTVFEGSVTTKTAELDGEKVSVESDMEVNRLSAGNGPSKPNDNETTAIYKDGAVTETVSHCADDFSVCDENDCDSVFAENNTEDSINSSVLLKVSEFDSNDSEMLSALEVDDLTANNACMQPESVSVSENCVIPDDSLSNNPKLHKNENLEETDMTGTDSHSVPASLTANANDDQLDSIEIIPESDIDEIKCVPDLNEEPPELLDCDSNDDITNNAYLGLTDSLCDLVLPFELENNNTSEDATVNNKTENEPLNDNAKKVSETEINSMNSKTNGHHLDSGMVENESEQWNKVEKSEVCDKDSVQDNGSNGTKTTNKPDFHTSLSLNGLRQELADLIDEDGNLTKTGMQTVLKTAASSEDIIPVLVTKGKR